MKKSQKKIKSIIEGVKFWIITTILINIMCAPLYLMFYLFINEISKKLYY